jgi:hypothetical protein
LDRGFLDLKRRYYQAEIARQQIVCGLRPEQYEPKRLRSRRDRSFALALFDLVRKADGRVFAYGMQKHCSVAAHNETALYTATVQGSLRQFEKFLRQKGQQQGQGIIIMDRRLESQNKIVLASALSYLFSAPNLASHFTRIIEGPLLVPSEWYQGVQAADVIGRVVSTIHRWRICKDPSSEMDEATFGAVMDERTAAADQWHSVYVRPISTSAATG